MTRLARPAAARFMALVDKSDACWMWLGATQAGGYGRFMDADGKPVLAHRWSYEHHVGPIPDGLTIDHLCRNTSCVRPDHLEPVTRSLNSWRASTNKDKTHCKRGHELTPANVYSPPSRPQVRDCRTCRRNKRQDVAA